MIQCNFYVVIFILHLPLVKFTLVLISTEIEAAVETVFPEE